MRLVLSEEQIAERVVLFAAADAIEDQVEAQLLQVVHLVWQRDDETVLHAAHHEECVRFCHRHERVHVSRVDDLVDVSDGHVAAGLAAVGIASVSCP